MIHAGTYTVNNARGLFRLDRMESGRIALLRLDLLSRIPLAANPLNRRDSQALADACGAVLLERMEVPT